MNEDVLLKIREHLGAIELLINEALMGPPEEASNIPVDHGEQ
jgi:hypothetical protein